MRRRKSRWQDEATRIKPNNESLSSLDDMGLLLVRSSISVIESKKQHLSMNPTFIRQSFRASRKTSADHVDEDDKGAGDLPTPGGKQQMTIINEHDYTCVGGALFVFVLESLQNCSWQQDTKKC